MKKLKSLLLFFFISLLMSCQKEKDIIPIIPPPITKCDVVINYSNSGRYLDKYEIILINENDSIIKIVNSNNFNGIPVGKYKLFGYSTPHIMTWENRPEYESRTTQVSTWVSDTIICEFKNEFHDVTLSHISTSTEITWTEKSLNVVGSVTIPLTDCDGSEYYLTMGCVTNIRDEVSHIFPYPTYHYYTFTSYVPPCK